MYKYIFCDLDGTLLDDDKNVSEENVIAIEKAQQKGCKFILCSGRAPFYMEDTLRQVKQFNNPDRYLLCLNGGCVTNACFEVFYSHPLDKKIAEKIFLMAEKEGDLAIAIAFENKYIRYDTFNITDEVRKKWGWVNIATKDEALRALREDKPYKLMIVSLHPERLQEYKKYLENLNEDIELVFSSDYFLEVNPKGVSKATGIEHCLEVVNGKLEDCIAIGDHYNDLDMISICGLGCCPSNANDEVKKKADYVCKNDNNHSAIKEIIDKFILGE